MDTRTAAGWSGKADARSRESKVGAAERRRKFAAVTARFGGSSTPLWANFHASAGVFAGWWLVSWWLVGDAMRQEPHVNRVLLVAGLAVMLIGAIDPLEGSVVILAGLGIVAVAVRQCHSRHRALIYWSLALMAVGVGAMYGLSAMGGVGGGSGRSYWWALVIVPYPVAWVAGLVGAVRALRETCLAPPTTNH